MSYREVRGSWWPARTGRTRAAAAPLLSRIGRRPGARAALAILAGAALAWVLVDAGWWLAFARDPALRLDPCRGLVPLTDTQALRTGEGHSYQARFNAFGSVILPAPRRIHHRVLLIGDSESASYAIDPRDHYGARLAARFPDVEFTCEAQPNYSLADFLRLARCSDGFAGYDLVVVQGCEMNGPPSFDPSRGRGLAVASLHDGRVDVTSEPLGWVGRHLALYNAVDRFDALGRRLMTLARELERVARHPRRRAAPASAGAPDFSATGPLLAALRREVKPPAIWLYLPRVHGVGDRRGPDDSYGPQFLADCLEAGFTVVDPGARLVAYRAPDGGYANGNPWTQPGTGHLNANGQRLLADAVAPEIARVLGSDPGGR